jgi:hypothetical protein
VKILKQQVITTLDKVKKSAELESKILSLEEQVLMQSSRITHMTERDHYMNEHLERAGEQLECKFLGALEHFSTKLDDDVVTLDAGSCLDNSAEKLRVGA